MLSLFCILALMVASAASANTHGSACECPEDASGWVIYPDSARGAPDFFGKSYVQVHKIIFCERAVHLVFGAKQAGARREVCVVVAEPAFVQHVPRDSVLSDEDLSKIERDFEWNRHLFAECIRELRSIVGVSDGDDRAIFKTGWFRKTPKLAGGSPLAIRWKGRSVELIGAVNVYFRE